MNEDINEKIYRLFQRGLITREELNELEESLEDFRVCTYDEGYAQGYKIAVDFVNENEGTNL